MLLLYCGVVSQLLGLFSTILQLDSYDAVIFFFQSYFSIFSLFCGGFSIRCRFSFDCIRVFSWCKELLFAGATHVEGCLGRVATRIFGLWSWGSSSLGFRIALASAVLSTWSSSLTIIMRTFAFWPITPSTAAIAFRHRAALVSAATIITIALSRFTLTSSTKMISIATITIALSIPITISSVASITSVPLPISVATMVTRCTSHITAASFTVITTAIAAISTIYTISTIPAIRMIATDRRRGRARWFWAWTRLRATFAHSMRLSTPFFLQQYQVFSFGLPFFISLSGRGFSFVLFFYIC